MRDYIIITDDMLDESYLEHYGVVGMKWHHRKAAKYAAKLQNSSSYNKSVKYTKKIQKHLNKNIKNNEKHNGAYGRKYEYLSDKDLRRSYAKYSNDKKAKAKRVAKVAAGVAIAAGVGYAAYKNRKTRPNYAADAQRVANETRNSFTSTRQQAQDAINNVRRSNQPKARTLAEARAATQSKPKTEQRTTYVPPIQAVLHENDLRRNQSRTTSTNRTEPKSQRHASVSEAAEALRRYQEAANRAASSLDNSRRRNSRPNYAADAQRVTNETRNSFTSTRQQAQDAINNVRRNAQSSSNSHTSVSDAAEAVRRYQEAANRAASSLDNTRNKRKRR